ncbi:MAG: hypothetical protein A3J74_02645 [Elusimicrobia bacterium RIFCSPHIGHO2_02_FULL_57_9]|nr:MAG: hypothetical protein A3J74_02645 [Elusimicrobia bacterium RIFCSPHIGHO2_02_FULL_57_9]
MTAGQKRVFKILLSDKCYRFKPDALPSHAPAKPGVYEFVTFNAQRQPIILYVGLALDSTIYDCLTRHLEGKAEPGAQQLFAAAKDVYFDYVAQADIDSIDDLKDIAGALIEKGKPRFNSGERPSSGKYPAVAVEEL